MRLRFLGTGTSFGIPVIGCDCATCTSDDPRDRRLRHGALLENDAGRRLLIDTPPELRLQLIAARIGWVDAVWFTHGHADHTHGVDDLRAFSSRAGAAIDAYAPAATAHMLRTRFDYIFEEESRLPDGTTRPEIRLHTLEPDRSVDIVGFRMTPLPLAHGNMVVFGFRTGNLGYVTDAKVLTSAVAEALRGVRVLVLNALWFGNPHPTHFNVEEAVEVARSIGAQRTLLTHLTHRVRHADLARRLPAGIEPAWDGLVVQV